MEAFHPGLAPEQDHGPHAQHHEIELIALQFAEQAKRPAVEDDDGAGASDEDDGAGAASDELAATLEEAVFTGVVAGPRLKIQIRPMITITATMTIIQVLRFMKNALGLGESTGKIGVVVP